MRMKTRILFIIFLISSVSCWWPWGDENEEEAEEVFEQMLEQDLSRVSIDDNVETIEKEQIESEAKLTKEDEKTIEKILTAPELVAKMDQQAFEDKLEEVIKATAIEHNQNHFDEHGEHREDFDHEAFLGDEAETFRHLSPEEAKVKLAIVVKKIDKDNNTLVTETELTSWIAEVFDYYKLAL